MENAYKSRWGIVAVAVAMFFVTMINASINGQKTSLYYWVWMMVGWYGYKGNLVQIRQLMKILIGLNVLVILGVLMFFEEETVGYVYRSASKQSMAFGVLVMLIPKLFMYMYCDKQIKELGIEESDNKTNGVDSSSVSKATNSINKESYIAKNTVSVRSNPTYPRGTQVMAKPEQKPVDEDKLWQMVADEYDSEDRKKGLYAKLFAESNGDENVAKAMYYKARVKELAAEATESVKNVATPPVAKQTHEKVAGVDYSGKTVDECMNENLYEEFMAGEYKCYELFNGKAMVITESRKLVYRNINALRSALETYARSGVFTIDNLVHETRFAK